MSDNSTTITGDVTRSAVVTGNGNTVTLSFGSALSVPVERRQIRVIERRQKGGRVERSELDLLNARTTPVPFFGRERELSGLRDWLDADTDLSVHALVAPAGTGKTRLAMELCRHVDPADAPGSTGWTAGFLASDDLPRLADAFSTGTYAWTGNTLLVVDYAGRSVEALRRWLDRLAATTLAPAKLRFLLLERTAPSEIGWWRTLIGVEASSADVSRRDLFWNPDLRPDDLHGLGDVTMRHRLFAAVLAAACERTGLAPPAVPSVGSDTLFVERLAEARFANPLALVMAGVLASRTTPVEALGLRHLEAARRIARRELDRLRRLAPTAEKPLVHLVTFGILAGGLPVDGLTETVAAELASAHLSGDVGALVEILRQEYPARSGSGGPQRLGTPEPDLIGEAMVVEARLHGGEDATSTAAVVERAYARGGATAAAALMRLLQDFAFPREDMAATASEREDAERLLGWLTRLADACGDVEALAPIVATIPQNTLVLREIALDLTARIVRALTEGEASAESVAPWLNNLGNRLSDLGRRETALAATEEAVDLYRPLANERPDAFRPDLAGALNSLGNSLSALGRREAALAATEEAVGLYKALTAERPDAFQPSLALSLNNLGTMLSALGRREAALAATEEAVGLYKALTAERPDAFGPDLAGALNSLGNSLSALGRREAALAATEEAVGLYKALTAERPDAFQPSLALSLNNLGTMLSALGRREAALAVTEEAVAIRRELAAERPDAFGPGLASSLTNLGTMLSAMGRREAALAATEEAVDLYRALATERPDAFGPGLASSLTNLGTMLSAMGRREAALAATEEAVGLYQTLAAERPDAFRPDLATSLNNLGNRLSALGRREAALAATEEAIAIRRELAAERPDAFRPDLASSLANLGNRLSALGRREAALAATEEAIAIRRELAAERPDAFRPDLAGTLNNLGAMLYALGRRESALKANEEAVGLYRALAAARPDAFAVNLSVSLGALADVRDASGDREAALLCIRDAVDVLRLQFLALPGATAQWMVMFLQRYFEWSKALGREPDLEWLAPISATLEMLQKTPPQEE